MTTSVTAGIGTISVKVDNPGRDDFGGLKIWRSTVSGFTPDASTMVYDGQDLSVILPDLPAGVPQYLKLALYSQIDPADYNISAEYSAMPVPAGAGLGIKINYASFAGANAGEAYLHGFDSKGAAADVDGYVIYNGVQVAVTKGYYVNPDTPGQFYVIWDKAGRALWTGKNGAVAQRVNGAWKVKATGTVGAANFVDLVPDADMIAIGEVTLDANENIVSGSVWYQAQSLNALGDNGATKGAVLGGSGANVSGQLPDENIANVKADKVTAGEIRGSQAFAGAIGTRGSTLTQAAANAAITLQVKNTADFPTSGKAYIFSAADPLADRNIITYTGKTATTLTGVTGVVYGHGAGCTIVPLLKSMTIDANTNELRFIGDMGNSIFGGALGYGEMASIGLAPSTDGVADMVIARFGALLNGFMKTAIEVLSSHGIGLSAITRYGTAIDARVQNNGTAIKASADAGGTAIDALAIAGTAMRVRAAPSATDSTATGTANAAEIESGGAYALKLAQGGTVRYGHLMLTPTGLGSLPPVVEQGAVTFDADALYVGIDYANPVWRRLLHDGSIVRADDGTAALPGLTFRNDGNCGLFRKAENVVGISIGGTERGYIDSTAITYTRLRLTSASDASLTSTLHGLQIGDDTGLNLAADNNEVQARNNGAASSLGINFDGGDINMGDASSVITSRGVHVVNLGIKFPATQAASADVNVLDDYEEGTFTPVAIGTTTAGAGTYTTQIGRYTKVGNRVHFSIHLAWSAHTGTGDLQVNGLPFTALNLANNHHAVALVHNGLAYTAGNTPAAYVAMNTASVLLRQSVPNAAALAIPMDTSVTALFLAGTYETA